MAEPVAAQEIETVYQAESRRALATLIRLLGDFDLAEEALQDAFEAALQQCPREGLPAHPRAWLVSTGRFKAIDALRRHARFTPWDEVAEQVMAMAADPPPDEELIADDRLRLIFNCCHPALNLDAQVALTLREVCGLSSEQIAHAFLVPLPTMAQRLVRAKTRIRVARIPYEVPPREALAERLDAVLRVVYLVFNEGYSASSGEAVTRHDLSAEAIRLGRLLLELLPDPEARGLLALMLLHDARRHARTTHDGEMVLLADQDRRLWDRARIDEGVALVTEALRSGRFGAYTLQAAIAAVHAEALDAASTDWPQIVGLYDVLQRVDASPVVALNRAVAIGMRDGPAAGIAAVDAAMASGALRQYHLAHAARADFLRRAGRLPQAREAYETALGLAKQAREIRFLQRRLDECRPDGTPT
ncbi:RNA polymerase sigma factor [Piscinibacter sp. HJYY11]|uniref:RNA polymerase sigma factor n=1 Tax=Piscinibacter sp. HJYY11 TaxID=2801333 RepID=UPI00191DA7D1|nr:RNA polymerase sigma factor [Piscinibacter sp. HJYY11]MBL0728228.1 RNA polymerase sigma factor [Piscinibacter sp. HJYY11]